MRLGFVAICKELKNACLSKTMTFTQFQKQEDREAAIRRMERIALENFCEVPVRDTIQTIHCNCIIVIEGFSLNSIFLDIYCIFINTDELS